VLSSLVSAVGRREELPSRCGGPHAGVRMCHAREKGTGRAAKGQRQLRKKRGRGAPEAATRLKGVMVE